MNRFIALLLYCASLAQAQPFPNRPITLIAPSAAGGSTDLICRALADAGSQRLRTPVIVVNRAGAGGALGAAALANAKPDGYTVALLPLGVFRLPFMQDIGY